MKSCWIVTKDHQAVLEWRDVPVPQPKAGEIVLRVCATAMNRGEIVVGGAVHGGPEMNGGTQAFMKRHIEKLLSNVRSSRVGPTLNLEP